MDKEVLKNLIVLSGYGHLILSMGSMLVPVALNWKLHLKDLQPLLRQMFWTYAAYILAINLTFGLICLFGTDELLGTTFLAKSIHLLIGIYWLTRIGIQFFYFDTTHAPEGIIFTLGEIILVFLFVLFAIVHTFAFLFTSSWV